eukprot:1138134-Pelagomonas_calceolata.AAC.9
MSSDWTKVCTLATKMSSERNPAEGGSVPEQVGASLPSQFTLKLRGARPSEAHCLKTPSKHQGACTSQAR